MVARSDRGEKLPARLDKTVLEIPAEKVSFLFFSFIHFPKQKGVTSSLLYCVCVCVCVCVNSIQYYNQHTGPEKQE